jgi:hypothetical protein
MGPDLRLVGLDKPIQRSWINVPLLDQHALQRSDPHLQLGQLRTMLVTVPATRLIATT